ncbi:MAG: Undecaprenyl-phosphate galactose phosphotransferase [Candidatus Solibacter sp.]|jgi:exopolysaccharide biosynthesis polyprenyl glycosylphosphotransferase|nr:Undecaprenyl-phosphate galactose phosphotransferase [Candidatus Solibacter sp.]
MFSRRRKARVLFGLSDVILVSAAFEIAYQTRVLLHLERAFYLMPERKAFVLAVALAAWVSIGLWLEIYEKLDTLHPRMVLRDAAKQCAYGALSLVVFEYAFRLELSRFFLTLFAAYAWVLLLTFRLTAGRVVGVMRREFGAPHYVMVVGTGARAIRMAQGLEQSAQYGVRLRGFLSEKPDAPSEIHLRVPYQVLPIADLPAILRQHVVDEIVFSVGTESLAELEEVFLLCDEEGVRTRVAVDFFPHVNSTVSLDRLGETPLLTFTAAPDDEIRLLLKRVIDLAIAAAGLIVLSPFMLLVIVLVRMTSRGPAIFRQVRCGLNGRLFVFYKFRSMVDNAEEMKKDLEHLNTRDTVFKIPDDPRLTALGRYLRKFSIDEWPQLWNVVLGDMSLVGPRPAVPSEVEQYQRWQRRRLRMRPGLTCLWAISGRDNVDFETWMKMDMQYIDNWSLALDWKILLQTIPRVLTGHGAN